MKRLQEIIAVSFLSALSAMADIHVGGRSWPLHFEDASLTAAERAAIEADVTAFWATRTNAVVEIGVDGIVRGRIFDDAVYAPPYAAERVEVPAWIVVAGTNWALRIPSDFSAAFRSGAAVRAARANELAALDSLLDGLAPERLADMGTPELERIAFRQEGAPPFADEDADRLRGELSSFAFFRPSALGIAETNGVSESPDISLVALVPAATRDSAPQDYSIARFGWNGAGWVLLSVF